MVRGTIVAFSNLTERQWLEDPTVRAAATRQCLGVIWIGPGNESLLNADLTGQSATYLQEMFAAFAKISGFQELELAPVIAMGHSAHGQFAWTFAQRFPERTIAAIAFKTLPLPADQSLPGIPLLYVAGETTEWPQYRDGKTPGDRDFFWPVVRDSALALRRKDPQNLIALATDPGAGHFDWSAKDASLIALFIEKACRYRLPAQVATMSPVKLIPRYAESGWLTDTAGVLPDRTPPAAYAKFQGKPADAYWLFDRDTALAIAAFNGDRMQRNKQMLSFLQDGSLFPVAIQGFAALRFEPQTDGITFTLAPAFLPEVPEDLLGVGTPLGHADGRIHLRRITGPAEQIAPDAFRIAMHRGEPNGDIWIEEEQDGDTTFRKALQRASCISPSGSAKEFSKPSPSPRLQIRMARIRRSSYMPPPHPGSRSDSTSSTGQLKSTAIA